VKPFSAREKYRDIAEIPRRHCLSAGHACFLIFVRRKLVSSQVCTLCQKPGHRLIADAPPEYLQLMDR
jgi:hypothetical protein